MKLPTESGPEEELLSISKVNVPDATDDVQWQWLCVQSEEPGTKQIVVNSQNNKW